MKKLILFFLAVLFIFCLLSGYQIDLAIDSGQIFRSPSLAHWGGTDSLGRDVLLRCLLGAYLSLMICLFSLFLTFAIGALVGSVLSFWRQSNHLVVFFIDIFDSIPNFLLVALFSILLNRGIGAAVSFNQSFFILVLSIGLSAWAPIARNVRLEILQLRGMDYLNASVVAGGSSLYIIRTHYVRALWPWVRVSLAHNIPQFLLIESVLSFTGFGISSQYATLGYLIYEGWKNALAYPYLFIVPSVVLCLLVLVLTRAVRSIPQPQ